MVDLQASGYGFCGLDSKGRVWVWGTLDGESYTASRFNWMDPATVCREPHQVRLVSLFVFVSISCARRMVDIIDAARFLLGSAADQDYKYQLWETAYTDVG